MSPPNIKRVSRLLRLVQTLRSGSGLDADGLATACGVSRRTLFRDIDSLRTAGVPVEFDSRDRLYRIDTAHFLPPMNLTVDEALALLILVRRTSPVGPQGLAAAAEGAVAKIEASLPVSMREDLRRFSEQVTIHAPAVNPLSNQGDAYNTLLQASLEKRVTQVQYASQTEYEVIQTRIKPYHMTFHQRSWFVVGHSSLHDEVRTFNVGRVQQAELLEEVFRIPKSFSIERHFGNAWGLIRETGADVTVRLRFSSLVARNVAEVLWHPKQQCEFADDGSLEYQVRVSGLREIVWWILGYGDQVEVLGPAKLRQLVATRLRAAATQYDDD